jgi:hypothetical protein
MKHADWKDLWNVRHSRYQHMENRNVWDSEDGENQAYYSVAGGKFWREMLIRTWRDWNTSGPKRRLEAGIREWGRRWSRRNKVMCFSLPTGLIWFPRERLSPFFQVMSYRLPCPSQAETIFLVLIGIKLDFYRFLKFRSIRLDLLAGTLPFHSCTQRPMLTMCSATTHFRDGIETCLRNAL